MKLTAAEALAGLTINAAAALQEIRLPAPLLLISVVLVSCFFDLFVGSASAKWSALAPIVVPMFMLLGISPEMTTAAYRMGDSVTNIATPLISMFTMRKMALSSLVTK